MRGTFHTNGSSRGSNKISRSSCIDLMKDKSSRFLELVINIIILRSSPKEEQIEKVHVVKGKLNFTEEEIDEAFTFVMNLMNQRAIQ